MYLGNNRRKKLTKYLVLGLTASFTVPLFLNMISSSLIKDAREDTLLQFVFFGICLIASVFSQKFLQSVSQKLLRELEQQKKDSKDIKQKINKQENELKALEQQKKEPIVHTEQKRPTQNAPKQQITDTDKYQVLGAIYNSKYSSRTLQGLQISTKSPIDKLIQIVNNLITEHLLLEKKSEEKEISYFSLTEEGINSYILHEAAKFL